MGFEPTGRKVYHFRNPALLHKAFSAIYLMVFKIYLYSFMRLNIDQITVYQSLFINKANVNSGSRNGMTCNRALSTQNII